MKFLDLLLNFPKSHRFRTGLQSRLEILYIAKNFLLKPKYFTLSSLFKLAPKALNSFEPSKSSFLFLSNSLYYSKSYLDSEFTLLDIKHSNFSLIKSDFINNLNMSNF